MSDAALRWLAQVQRDQVLTGKGKGRALSVLLELCDCHNGKSGGQCNPSFATLMKSTHTSRSSLYRALATLREQVGVSTHTLPNGSTQYNLPIPDWAPGADDPPGPTAPPPTSLAEKKRIGGRELLRYILSRPIIREGKAL